MAKKLFVLGLPGSGKSKVARYITELLEQAGVTVVYHNDFEILNQMYENDTDHLFKHPDDDGVFDVCNPVAFDIALNRLGQVIFESIDEQGEEAFYIIEFSRNDYRHAFSLLNKLALLLHKPEFLTDAHYIHLGTSVENCKIRIRERTADPVYEDDYPVSDYIFVKYYHSDDGKILPEILSAYGVAALNACSLSNDASFEAIIPAIKKTVSSIFEQESEAKPVLEQEDDVPAIIT